ncbi:hypothetical protein D9M71_718300 [compost metagenome]
MQRTNGLLAELQEGFTTLGQFFAGVLRTFTAGHGSELGQQAGLGAAIHGALVRRCVKCALRQHHRVSRFHAGDACVLPLAFELGQISIDLDHRRGQISDQHVYQVLRRQPVTLLEFGHGEVRPEAVVLDRLFHKGGGFPGKAHCWTLE